MKKLLLAILIATLVLSFAGCANQPNNKDTSTQTSEIQSIKSRGKLRVGTKVDVPYFGYLNADTNEMEGLEVDIAKALAKEILGDENAVEFAAVTAKTRGPLLDNNEIDVVIATFTITEERKLSYNFTEPYFTDSIGFLVKKELEGAAIKDLDGKTIGVAQTATTKQALEDKANELGITFKFSEFASYPELKTALTSGRIDAFSVDKSILLGYLDDSTALLTDSFKPQEYGIASKLDKKELAAYLNDFITKMNDDGTLSELIKKWRLDK